MRKAVIITVLAALVLLFAGCDVDPDATYKVIYHGNGQTYGFAPNDPNQYTSGMVAVILDKGTLIKEGAMFVNWNTDLHGSGDSYEAGGTITINDRDVFLYAIWIETDSE